MTTNESFSKPPRRRVRMRFPTLKQRLALILAEQELEERKKREALRQLIEAGPPAGSSVKSENWRDWHRYGFFVCPRTGRTCTEAACRLGPACVAMRAFGLTGNGSPLPRKERPACGARNRRNAPCAVRVEPGKRRCRFHGGLSTGPKTTGGRARIAEAQRRRWNRASI
jgi:hypothetical protein